jgi:hypothetical protein
MEPLMNDHIFISHSTEDDEFVKELRETLENHGINSWVDSRELKGGDALLPEIQNAIENAAAFIVVMSFEALNSSWVYDETEHALKVKKKVW